MKKLSLALAVVTALPAIAQQTQAVFANGQEQDTYAANAAQIAANAVTWVHRERTGSLAGNIRVEVAFSGTPSTMTTMITGCMRGANANADPPAGTCGTPVTNSSTSSFVQSIVGPWDYYTVTTTWTGSVTALRYNLTGTLSSSSGTGGAVQSVNGQTGVVSLDAANVNADSSGRVIYDEDSWANLLDFTTVGSPGLSIVNNKLVTTAANNSNFANYFYLTQSSNDDDDLDIEVTFSPGQGTGSYGLGIGKLASNPTYNQWGAVLYWNPDVSPYQLGTFLIQPGVAGTQVGSYTSGGTFASGNIYKVVYTQRGPRFVFYNYDYTNKSVYTNINNLGLAGCSPQYPNSDWVGIANNGGTYTIERIRVISRKAQQPQVATAFDSKGFGCNAVSRDLRFASTINSIGPVAAFAGSGDTTQSVLNDLNYILASNPKDLLLNIGRNDLANGVATATWQANYSAIVSGALARGVRVVHLLPIPETTVNQAALTTFIQTTFAGQPMIDPSVGWVNATMLSSDGTHPTPVGHAHVKAAIIASGYWTLSTYPYALTVPRTPESLYPLNFE